MATRKKQIDVLKKASKESSDLIDRLTSTSEKVSSRSSEVVFGAFGGAVGLLAAMGLEVLLPQLQLFLLAPSLGAAGMLASVIAYRGPAQFQIERKNRRDILRLSSWLEQRKMLPDDINPRIKETFDEHHMTALDMPPAIPKPSSVDLKQLPPPPVLDVEKMEDASRHETTSKD